MRPAVASFLASLLLGFLPAALADQENPSKLQGEVNEQGAPSSDTSKPIEPMPQPVLSTPKKPLQGVVQQEDKANLKGNAEDDDGQLNGMTPGSDKAGNALKGEAKLEDGRLAGEDPDQDDQELMVQWDKWRNRFFWAVQSGVQEALNNPDDTMLRWDPQRQTIVTRFPLGTTAWFSCQVTPDKRITNLHVLHSSGYPNFDKAVLNAIQALNGTAILRYPSRSRRQIVSQMGGIKTSATSEQQYFHFGDVEKYRVPGGQ